MAASLKTVQAVEDCDHAPKAPREGSSVDAASDGLEWLLDIGSQLSKSGSWTSFEAHREQLSRLLAAAVRHLGCTLGALIVPGRAMRLIEVSCGSTRVEVGVLVDLEQAVLRRIFRENELVLVNRARAGNSPRLRLLAVPVAPRDNQATGALLFIRSVKAPRFMRVDLVLALHVSRLIAASLKADLDAASGLYTRVGLQGQIGGWGSSEEGSSSAHAIVAIKIDRLDAINASSGFDTGDALIAGVAGLLQALHGPPDALTGRIASNEFALILRNAGVEKARAAAETLQRVSETLLSGLSGVQGSISLSCGIASFGSLGDFEAGLVRSQLARKMGGRPGRIEHRRDTDVSVIQRHAEGAAVKQLAEALRENRLVLFAQQIVPLHPGLENGGYELLLRSMDYQDGNRTPLHLLSAAQRSHLAPALDLWIIERALTEAAPHRTKLRDANVTLAINLSGPSLLDQNTKDRIRWLIAESHLGPTRFTFEITEAIGVLSLARAVAFIQELRALGCRFAVDDFGTGAGSLKSLMSLPVDRVKIDGNLISGVRTNTESESMVRAIVSLARDLGVSTVAESVESLELVERLRELGVQYAQGYAIDVPRPLAEVLRDISAEPTERCAPQVNAGMN